MNGFHGLRPFKGIAGDSSSIDSDVFREKNYSCRNKYEY